MTRPGTAHYRFEVTHEWLVRMPRKTLATLCANVELLGEWSERITVEKNPWLKTVVIEGISLPGAGGSIARILAEVEEAVR